MQRGGEEVHLSPTEDKLLRYLLVKIDHHEPRLIQTVRGIGYYLRISGAAGSGRAAVFEAQDHGQPMREEVAALAFEGFFRGDPARSRHPGGSGLGLSIVRSVVDAHGGSAHLVSTLGRGTTVRIEMPTSPRR